MDLGGYQEGLGIFSDHDIIFNIVYDVILKKYDVVYDIVSHA